jgi:hypothetical protein
MTSCRPSRRASFPSLGDATPALVFRPPRGRALPRASLPELVTRYLRPGNGSVETTGSPTFLGNPYCALALLSDPGRTDASGLGDAPTRPPICPPRRLPHSYFRGSITRLRHWLSTLRSAGYPYTTQDSLPAVGQTLPDGLDYPQGSIERFRAVSYISSSFPKFNVAQGHLTSSSSSEGARPSADEAHEFRAHHTYTLELRSRSARTCVVAAPTNVGH